MASVYVNLYPTVFAGQPAGADKPTASSVLQTVGKVACVVAPVAGAAAPFLLAFPPVAIVVGIVAAVAAATCAATQSSLSSEDKASIAKWENVAKQIAAGIEKAKAETAKYQAVEVKKG
jgi:hypothetical protein